jgi:acid phosphatase
MKRSLTIITLVLTLGLPASALAASPESAAPKPSTKKQSKLPTPDHIVIVIEENKDYDDVIGETADAPYLNKLAQSGALLTRSYGLHHPSQPNYLELFSGDEQGVCNDDCPPPALSAPNLAASLLAKQGSHLTFTGYAESLPADHAECETPKIYGRKHCPWLDFTNVPASATKDFTEFPTTPQGFKDDLPTVAIVIPNLVHDMHNLPNGGFLRGDTLVNNGDTWLSDHLKAYADWAMTNNSLLIITWDEDGSVYRPVGHDCEHQHNTRPPRNHIATIIVGDHVRKGPNAMRVTHYNLLRTIEDMYGLPLIGGSAAVPPITDIWQ